MRSLLLVATFTVGGALNAGAQTPTPPAPAIPGLPGALVTAEGCVTRESASPQTAAIAREPAAAMQYVLTEHTPPAPFVPDGSASSGATTPLGERTPGRKLYVLVARDGDTLDFAKHLNHIVRVTGAALAPMPSTPPAGRSPVASPVAGATGATGTTAPAGATGTPFGTTIVPTLAVTTLAMVSSTCR